MFLRCYAVTITHYQTVWDQKKFENPCS